MRYEAGRAAAAAGGGAGGSVAGRWRGRGAGGGNQEEEEPFVENASLVVSHALTPNATEPSDAPGPAVAGGAAGGDWLALAVTVVACFFADICVFQRLPDMLWTHLFLVVFWAGVSFAFSLFIRLRQGPESFMFWLFGYYLEWMLSVDNLFLYTVVFSAYRTPEAQKHKALFYGILSSVVMRLLMFSFVGAALHRNPWAQALFGLLLMFSGAQACFIDDDKSEDVANTVAERCFTRCLGSRLHWSYDHVHHSFFARASDGRLTVTLLAHVLLCLEVADALFALDSVSAKVAVIPDHYIAYSSTVMATFGLRAAFFLLNDCVQHFELLRYAVGFSMTFIGVQLVMPPQFSVPEWAICAFILAVFFLCILSSLVANALRKGTDVPRVPRSQRTAARAG